MTKTSISNPYLKMDFKIAFTDKEITALGGMIFMKKLIEKSGIVEKLNEVELPSQKSNRGYAPLQLIESFWISVWCGANRFMHLDVLHGCHPAAIIWMEKNGWSPSISTLLFEVYSSHQS